MSNKDTGMMSTEKNERLAPLPQLRFPEFRDAGGWRSEFGDEVFDQVSNKNHNSDLPVLAITQEHGAIPRNLIDYHVSVADKSIEGYKVVEVGDFIISLRSFQGGIEYSKYQGICSPAYVVLRLKCGHSEDYFRQLLKTDRFITQLNKNLEGLRDGKMVSYKQFSELPLPVPSQAEQQKIADCLSSLDELITAETQKLDKLKTHRKGLVQQLFPSEGETVPLLRFPGFQEAEEWEVKPLAELAENLDSRRIPITESNRIKGNIPYYGASGVVDYIDGYIFDEDLLCVSEDGANLVARTTPIAFSISGKTWVNNHAHVLRFASRYSRLLVEAYLNSISLLDYLTGMAQPKLNRGMLDTIPVPLPRDENERIGIAGCLSAYDELIAIHDQKIDALKLHKRGLMQQMFPAISASSESES
ncbi:restriction endonuclease subunit S [Paraburkholderia sp. A2WS-5]|uniref:restriction endonuclease subunit S n=1 Tax=Paraburkholderia sp. A2WS-5 TaxID=3028372 RepID=UPI003B7C4BDF